MSDQLIAFWITGGGILIVQVVILWLGLRAIRADAEGARAAADQAIASAEQARLEREIAQQAAGEATQAKGEIVRLGMAMDADTDSGAPPAGE